MAQIPRDMDADFNFFDIIPSTTFNSIEVCIKDFLFVCCVRAMGKKQHSKDRMFITKTEWATEWGGAKSKVTPAPFKRLPFYCCALAFTPFENPVCTVDGSVFDLMNIIPYISYDVQRGVYRALAFDAG